MQFSNSILILGLAASSVSASALISRQSSGSNGPNVPTCTNQDPSCNLYGDISVCVPSCYTITGAENYIPPAPSGTATSVSAAADAYGPSFTSGGLVCATNQLGGSICNRNVNNGFRRKRQDASFTTCDFNTLTCTDGKQLTGCRVPGSTNRGTSTSETAGGECGIAQGDGRDTGAAAPGTASNSTSSASAIQTASSSAAATSPVSTSAAATKSAANTVAAASASASPKSNGAADVRPHAVGALLAVGALASMLF